MSSYQKNLKIYQKSFLDSVNRGIADADSGNVYTTEELKKELEKRRLIRQFKSNKINPIVELRGGSRPESSHTKDD